MSLAGRILEGIMTTCGEGGQMHVAPMGPIVNEEMTTFLLRPYQTSTTYQNLRRNRQGVFHVTDDVELLARAAVGRIEVAPPLRRAETVAGWILTDACRWYEFEVDSIDDRSPRTEILVHVVANGRQRDFFGFNRAMHAVVETAILATRLNILERPHILAELARLEVPVQKTAGPREAQAFAFLKNHIEVTFAQLDEAVLPSRGDS